MAKHEEAIARFDAEVITSVWVTISECSLLKFPSDASAPRHRIVATVAGQRARLVVGLIINQAPTDHGQLRAAMSDTRKRLSKAGLPSETGQNRLSAHLLRRPHAGSRHPPPSAPTS